jgi:hypothetical protein
MYLPFFATIYMKSIITVNVITTIKFTGNYFPFNKFSFN